MSEKAKKGFKMPSSYTVLLIIIAFMAVMTWIIPAGAFVDGVYKSQPQNPRYLGCIDGTDSCYARNDS